MKESVCPTELEGQTQNKMEKGECERERNTEREGEQNATKKERAHAPPPASAILNLCSSIGYTHATTRKGI